MFGGLGVGGAPGVLRVLCGWCIALALAGRSGVVYLEVDQTSLVIGTRLTSVHQ